MPRLRTCPRVAGGYAAMRIAIIGQQKFGKSVLDAFLERGDTVAGVFCAPEKPGAAPDPLRVGGRAAGHCRCSSSPPSRAPRRWRPCVALDVDLGVMAYVLQFAPEDFTAIPRHGTIQFHPVAVAALPGTEFHQLAHHPRRHAYGAHDLPADRRPRRRARSCCKRKRRLVPMTRSEPCISTGCSRWASRRFRKRPTWS